MNKNVLTRAVIVAGLIGCAIVPLQAAEIINNGGFEAGFSGWVRANSTGSDGTFYLQSGTASPVNGTPVPAPPSGSTAAMTDAQGPGSHVLYQDFTVTAPVQSAALAFSLFLGNSAGTFFVPTPNTLDFGVAAFNQQARVDILLGSASAFSLSSSDVLLNVFQTSPGTPVTNAYSSRSTDIASLLNTHLNTVLRLRFAETDNVSVFQFGVDNVSLQTSPVPEPSTLITGGLGALLFYGIARLRRRHKAASHLTQ